MRVFVIKALRGNFTPMDPHPDQGALPLRTVKHGQTERYEVEDIAFDRIKKSLDDFQARSIIVWNEGAQLKEKPAIASPTPAPSTETKAAPMPAADDEKSTDNPMKASADRVDVPPALPGTGSDE